MKTRIFVVLCFVFALLSGLAWADETNNSFPKEIRKVVNGDVIVYSLADQSLSQEQMDADESYEKITISQKTPVLYKKEKAIKVPKGVDPERGQEIALAGKDDEYKKKRC